MLRNDIESAKTITFVDEPKVIDIVTLHKMYDNIKKLRETISNSGVEEEWKIYEAKWQDVCQKHPGLLEYMFHQIIGIACKKDRTLYGIAAFEDSFVGADDDCMCAFSTKEECRKKEEEIEEKLVNEFKREKIDYAVKQMIANEYAWNEKLHS